MATTVAELVARLTADVSGFKRGMAEADAALGRNAKSLSSLGASMQDFGKRLTLGVTLPVAAAAVAGFRELESAGKVAAQTTAVIKSTGGAANITARQVDAMGTSLSRMSGIDDELIKSGTNLILTFRNVHNELGRGNQIVDRATKAALDLSVAGFGDMTSTSKMLGKALNDPIAGLTAMSRAGVTFTKSQKESIMAMVESGNLLGAQKKILREVELQVGGSAKAYGETLAGQVGKAKEALLNSAAAIMATAAPAIQFIAGVAREFADVLQSLPGPIRGVIGALMGVAAVAGPLIYIAGGLARNFAALAETATGAKLIGGLSGLSGTLAGFGALAGIAGGVLAFGVAIKTLAGHSYDAAAGIQKLTETSDRLLAQQVMKHFVEDVFRNGVTIKESFRQIAETSYGTALRVRDAMAQSGQSTAVFDQVLKQVAVTHRQAAADAQRGAAALDGLSTSARGAAGSVNSIPDKTVRINADASGFWNTTAAVKQRLQAVGQGSATPRVGGMGGGSWIPWAKGGIVTRATPSIIGEAGPEAIIPLSDPRRGAEVMRAAGLVGGGGGTTVVVHVGGSVVSERQLTDAIHEGLLAKQRRSGTLGLN